jgi:type IV pilus assembly protein PilC
MEFEYFAKKITGEEKRGTMNANDKLDLLRMLKQDGYTLISCNRKLEDKKFNFSIPFLRKVSIVERIVFSRNFSIMISAGLPISKCLDILSRQTRNKKFSKILNSILEDVQKGNTLSDSMKKYPKIFPNIFTAMVRVGEESGRLSDSLKIMANQMDRDHSLVKKVRGAMIYPVIILTAMFIIGVVMMIYVVPTLISVFKELEAELPTSTKIIVFISDFLTESKFTALMILIGVSAFFIWFIRTKKGKRIMEIISLKTPIVSQLVKKINSARTSRTMASLISSGVNILEALDITKDVLQNSYYKEIIDKAKANIQKGDPISEAFKKATNLYAVLFGEMMAVGEETGKLPDMLYNIADFYDEEVSETTKNLATVIEPFLMIIIGVIVGFFAISMVTPMYTVMNNIQ